MIYTIMFDEYEFPNKTFEVDTFELSNIISSDQVARKHGSIIQKPYLKDRVIRVNGILHSTDKSTTRDQLDAMQTALFGVDSGWLKIHADRRIKAHVRDIRPKNQKGSDLAILSVGVDFISDDPFFVAVAGSNTDSMMAPATTIMNIFSGGSAFTTPKIYIYASGGTITDDIQLVNTTNDSEILQYRGILANGTTLTINTADHTVLNNSVSGITDFSGDFINVLAGTNQFIYTGATATITIEHIDRWY